MTTLLLLDGGWPTTLEAEHALREHAQQHGLHVVYACTHFVTGGPRVVATAEVVAPAVRSRGAVTPEVGAADTAGLLAAHRERRAGRVFVFPGDSALTGVLTVDQVLARSSIDRVIVVGGAVPEPGVEIDTQGFVRPEFRDGVLVLCARPAVGGRLVPFEQPQPTPCCADHA